MTIPELRPLQNYDYPRIKTTPVLRPPGIKTTLEVKLPQTWEYPRIKTTPRITTTPRIMTTWEIKYRP